MSVQGKQPGTDWQPSRNTARTAGSLMTRPPDKKEAYMSTQTTTTVSENLRVIADMIDAHPELPQPFVSAYTTGHVDASWYLHIDDDLRDDLPAQKAIAARLVSTLGGKWDKQKQGDDYRLRQERDGGLTLDVVVNRAAVCERVVTGTREVIVPATPARDAKPEHVETVEEVKWVCSSLLAEAPAAHMTGRVF